MDSVMKLVNNPVMWVLSFAIVSVVVVQTIIYYRLAKQYVSDTNILTKKQVNVALKVGAIGTIGPAIAVFTVAVVLIGMVGGPITLSRVGVIGSAAFESLAASVGSSGTVGTENITSSLITTASWVMTIGGSGWLISTFFVTKGLDNAQEKMKKSNPKTIAYIASFTPFMVFFIYASQESLKGIKASSYGILAATFAGGISMYICNKISSSNSKYTWLREWAMGLSIIVAMLVGVVFK